MKAEVAELKTENIQGIVAGVLNQNHRVDIAKTRELVALASPLSVTFHRAFDGTPDLSESLEAVIQAGAQRILTSGGAPDAAQGAPALGKLIDQARGRITILPGGGLHSANIPEVLNATCVTELHTGLGTILAYHDPDSAKFEQAVRACRVAAAFRGGRFDNPGTRL
jgi:copper homeostasis protein